MKKRLEKKVYNKDKSDIIGKCYLCGKKITTLMIHNAKAVKLNDNKYRCRSKRCDKKVCNEYFKKLKGWKKVFK